MLRPYYYHDFAQPDPPHQGLYLELVLRFLRSDRTIVRVLDAGCGDGNFTASLSDEGFEMYGIDLSSGGISTAKERYPQVSFFQASLYDSFTAACGVSTFDAVVAIEVIEHLYSPRQFVQRAHAALRPGGLFVVTTPYWGYVKNVLLSLTNRIDRALTSLWEGGHIKHYSYQTLRQLLTVQGFDYIAFHGAGRKIPYLWKGMVMVVRKASASPNQ